MSQEPDQLEEFEFFPFTNSCQLIWEEHDHLLIGVSPGNSYFSAQRLGALARWAAQRFTQVDFVHADVHLDEIYEAFGYTPEHAQRRAAKEIRTVRRRITEGLASAGLLGRGIRMSALSEFADNPVYTGLRRRLDHLVDEDEELREACEAMVQQFLAPRLQDSGPATAEQLRSCRAYIAAELPFFVDTPSILGVPSSVSAYPVVMPLTEVLYRRGGGLRAMRNQAYAVLRSERTVKDDHRRAA
ncbi:tRNA-dependent cyclodipeptide synthase [Streptomyces sp. RB6PN25]|uniref:Cyclodipeptide synthase n=1 Tax=Streptomyces humicola TaxID=2953240 RepID=A0ABT1PS30_9ACTN|nr:tRNA-dependent cyclodipeptide synthase [Streptomyces humicola]MCQ4080481.1 tRNA-dependent cyclodipeptide synthase [Streptomyces humicola]